jgi:hypothetical protein
MKNHFKNLIATIAMGALVVLSPTALSAGERRTDAPLESAAIAKMAKDAKSAAQHAEVAKQYELRGKALEEQADKIARELQKQRAEPSAMATKWPAMVANARERQEQIALQKRRAAEECYTLARHHKSLAGESIAAE